MRQQQATGQELLEQLLLETLREWIRADPDPADLADLLRSLEGANYLSVPPMDLSRAEPAALQDLVAAVVRDLEENATLVALCRRAREVERDPTLRRSLTLPTLVEQGIRDR